MYLPGLRVVCVCTLFLLTACGGGGGGGGGGPTRDLVAALAAPASVVPGESYTYTVTGTATGGAVQSVGATLTLPATVAIGAITGGGVVSGSAITWPTTASLLPGTPLSYTVTVTAPSIGPLNATLQLTTTSAESAANNSVTRRTVLGFTVLATLNGQNPGDSFGFVADTVGDITGDGRPDFVTTSPFNNATGRAYVYSGATSTVLYTLIGTAGETFGWSAAAAGDVDGDGTGDIIVGGPGAGAGVARVYSGDDGTLIHTLAGPSAGSRFGVAVASLGDINADGRADLLVGAEGAATTGQALVISGIDGATLRTHTGPSGPNFGQGVAGLGDVSGDAVPDYAIGGGFLAGGFVEVHSGATGALLYTVTPAAGASAFGFIWIDAVGDVDGDSRPDFFAADTDSDGHRGRGYLISGATGTIIRSHFGDGGPEQFGIARHGGFDVDGDTVPDLFIAGYHNSEGATEAGKAFVYSGATGALLRTMTSTQANQTLGYDALQLGDVDGDGLVDYLLTGGQEIQPATGIVYVIKGTALP